MRFLSKILRTQYSLLSVFPSLLLMVIDTAKQATERVVSLNSQTYYRKGILIKNAYHGQIITTAIGVTQNRPCHWAESQ